jgi:hypothetical protein
MMTNHHHKPSMKISSNIAMDDHKTMLVITHLVIWKRIHKTKTAGFVQLPQLPLVPWGW